MPAVPLRGTFRNPDKPRGSALAGPSGPPVEVRQVRTAPAIRGPKPPPGNGGAAKRLHPPVQPALGSVGPRPDPDLLCRRHGAEEIDVPTKSLFSPNVSMEARRQIPLRRPGVEVPTGRQSPRAVPPGRQPPRAAEAQDEAVHAGVLDRATPISLPHSFPTLIVGKPPISPITQIMGLGPVRGICEICAIRGCLVSPAAPGGAFAVKRFRRSGVRCGSR